MTTLLMMMSPSVRIQNSRMSEWIFMKLEVEEYPDSVLHKFRPSVILAWRMLKVVKQENDPPPCHHYQ